MAVYLGSNEVCMRGGSGTASSGIDTSDATATSQDMASGVTAYVNGEKITGVARTVTTYTGYKDLTPVTSSFSGTNYICLNSPDMDANGILFKEGSHFYLGALPSTFGNATAADVASGKTFTSSAGLKVTGTASSSSSGSSMTVKTGTTTSGTISTGLSSINTIVIYKDTIAATGLVQGVYSTSDSTLHYTYCSSYSTWTKTCTVGTSTASSVSGGTFTLGTSGTSGLSSSTTYNWIAFGNA